MAFPDSPILDDFDRADEVLSQSADWWDYTGFRVLSNQAVSTNNNTSKPTIYLTAGVLTDCEVYVTIPDYSVPGSESVAVVARYNAPNNSGYILLAAQTAGTLRLARLFENTTAGLGSWTPGLAVGDSIGIRCVGTTITVYHKPVAGAWGALGSVVDTNYASGYIGMSALLGVEIDDFGGGATLGGAFPATPVLDTFTQADTDYAPPNTDWADLSALWVLSQACGPPAFYYAPTTRAVWDTAIASLKGEAYFTHTVLMDNLNSVGIAFFGDAGGEVVSLAVARVDATGDEWRITATGGAIGPVIQDVLAGDKIGLAYDDDTGRAIAYHYTPSVGIWVPVLGGVLVGTFPTSTEMHILVNVASGAIDDLGGGATSGIVMPTSTGPEPRVAAWQRPDTRAAEEV